MATLLAQKHRVTGFDIDKQKVEDINSGVLPFYEPGLEYQLKEAIKRGYWATTEIEKADAFIVSVPTGVTKDRRLDDRPLIAAVRSIAEVLEDGNLVIIESTVAPGTCQNIVAPILDESGKSYHLAYVPERAIPGSTMHEMVKNDRTIGADSNTAYDMAKDVYSAFVTGSFFKTSLTGAEMVKLAENASRNINIAFANELADIATSHGVNVWEVIQLANLHPRVHILNPGAGVGGHCIPVDPWFLIQDTQAPLNEMALRRNEEQPEKIADWIFSHITEHRLHVKIALLGEAYKADCDDLRNAPTARVKELLEQDEKISCVVHDPHTRPDITLACALSNADIAVILVAHNEYRNIDQAIFNVMRDKIVFDCCNVVWSSIKRAGVTLHRLGDTKAGE